MTQVRSGGAWAEMRSTVSCKSVRSPENDRNCLGRLSRLRGQNRVPPPPAMIIACSMVLRSGRSRSRLARLLRLLALPARPICYGSLDQRHLHAVLGDAFQGALEIGNSHVVRTSNDLLGGETCCGAGRSVADLLYAKQELQGVRAFRAYRPGIEAVEDVAERDGVDAGRRVRQAEAALPARGYRRDDVLHNLDCGLRPLIQRGIAGPLGRNAIFE